MAENKKSFILYCDLLGTISKLPDDQAGKLFKHILEYVNDKDPKIDDNLLLEVAFEPIKQTLKRDLQDWERKREARSAAGKKGMESKWGNSDAALLRSERMSEARKKGTHTKEQWKRLIEICENKCVKCGNEDIVKDHIKPIYQGGSDSINNLQPLCKFCNSSKGADSTNYIMQFLQKMPNKSNIAYQELTKITVSDSVNESVNVKVKENNIVDRKLKFSETLSPFLETYGRDMLNEFYRYWTEPNKSNTKFRMELERTWDLKRRLDTWDKNQKIIGGAPKVEKTNFKI
mgnify:CR=1 FL=1